MKTSCARDYNILGYTKRNPISVGDIGRVFGHMVTASSREGFKMTQLRDAFTFHKLHDVDDFDITYRCALSMY